MRTYFPRDFYRPFGKLHRLLVEAIWETAHFGGKIAVAAPRGRGKTTIVKGAIAAVILAGLVRFPVPIGPTTKHAGELYEDFRRKIAHNDLIFQDFPEIAAPVRALEGSPQRAGRQHIDGHLTHIQWTADGLRLPNVPAAYRGPIDYGGVRMEYRGLDAAIRGINRDGDRPDFVPIDEPETRRAAKSDTEIADRDDALKKDIAGLSGEDKELAQVMITTIQNRKCISFIYTDPDQEPSWMGKRFGWVEKWPIEWTKEGGLWHTYIAKRAQDQKNGDRYGRTATQFFLENEDAMVAGGELLADNYKAIVLKDGWVTVHSAWQVVFNAIADTSYEAFCTEYQNDPPESEEIQTLELTHAHVASCHSGLDRGVKPSWCKKLVRGIDMGKVDCWFVDIAFDWDGTGAVINYGKFNTFGLSKSSSHDAIQTAMMKALETFAIEGTEYEVDYALVDSGYKPDAIYEACRRITGDYFPLKGPDGHYRQPKPRDDGSVTCFFECHISQIKDQFGNTVHLFHPNTEYWKNWLQERWTLEPFTGEERTIASMAVFNPENNDNKVHTQFAKSMIAERLEHVPLPGKAMKATWKVIDRANNHWLDAAGYACAAASCLGVKLIEDKSKSINPDQMTQFKVETKPGQPKQFTDPYGRPFLATQR